MSDVRVRVRDGWAVFDGTTQRSSGEEFEVPSDLAGRWSIAGWVELMEPAKPKRRKRSS